MHVDHESFARGQDRSMTSCLTVGERPPCTAATTVVVAPPFFPRFRSHAPACLRTLHVRYPFMRRDDHDRASAIAVCCVVFTSHGQIPRSRGACCRSLPSNGSFRGHDGWWLFVVF